MKTLSDTLQTQRIQLRSQQGLRASLMLVAPCLAAVALYLWACPAVRADNNSPVEHSTERLAKGLFFRTPLIWAGDIEPNEAESSRLWNTLISPQKDTRSADDIEAFITDNPHSPWTPSLRSQLAKQYAENGRYTRALAHWEEAWEATKYMDGPGKQVADFALAHWTRLLLRLGRTEKVRLLFQETQGRLLDRGPLQVIFDETKEAMAAMQSHPEAVQGCGGFALAQIARTMTGTNASRNAAFRSAMPPQGYSLQALSEMASGMQLGLSPAVREKGGGWVVPALAHMRQNHYIAIIAQTNDSYRVVDPILGRPKWMSAETLEEECSGFVLIPSAKMPSNWKTVSQQEARQVLGKGWVSIFNNDADTPPCETCPCPPGGPTRGDCPACKGGGSAVAKDSSPGGMPHWMVSEPFINLWVEDEPLAYQPATGPRISLKVFYKQRADRDFDTNVFGFGPNWNCSWLSYVEPGTNNDATLHVAGGGIRSFVRDGTTLEYQSNCRMLTNDNPVRYEVLYQSGAKDVYGFIRTNESGSVRDAYMSRREDERGRATTFYYATNNTLVRLLSVVDADGQTNSLRYEITNASSSNMISHVVDRFGRTARFAYDASGYLTQIIDVADLTNSFAYDSSTNDNYNSMTNLVTPYGTNTFRHGYTDIGGYTNRWITIAEPESQFQMFLFQQASSLPESYLGTGLFPDNYFYNYLFYDPSRQTELDYYYMDHRNSFHWGRNQCAQLIAQYSTFFENPADDRYVGSGPYDIARLRHWSHNRILPDNGYGLGSSLSMERKPSPDGTTTGQMTWYGYTGKTDYYGNPDSVYQGVSAFPSLVIKVMPDGSEWYEEYQTDSWGNRTNIISTYWNGGAVQTRTNRFVYDSNGIDLLAVIGPDGTRESSYASTNHQVLRMTNALNEVTSYTYNTARQVTSIQEPSGLVTANIYDANGWRIQTYSYAIENGSTVYYGTNSFNYTNGLVRTHTDERGLTVTNTWDNLQRLTRVDYPATAEYPSPTAVAYTYNRLDLVRVVDRMNYTHSYVYDGLGQKVSETNALVQITTYSYCSCGSSEYVTQAVGTSFERQTHYVHDNQGRMTNTFYPDDYAVTNLYDSLGRVTNITDNAGISMSHYYNHQGLIQTISNNVGQVAAYRYDINDRVTNIVDANGISVVQTFDNLGRLLSRTNPTGGGTESWGYSPNTASPTRYTNQVNAATEMLYNARGLKIKDILGKGTAAATTNQYTYTAAGDLESLVDGKNQSTTWHYSRYGLITNKCDASSAEVFRYKYDADSRLTNRWSKAKGNNYYTYDEIGNLLSVNYQGGGGFTNQYDGLNQVTNRVDVLGSTSYLYHTNGLLQSEDGPWPNDTVSYGYTINRLRQSLSLKNTSGTLLWGQTNSYDAANRLTGLISGAGAFVYQYPTGSVSRRVQKLTLANTSFIDNTYDALARLTVTTLKNSTNAALNIHQYGYNQAGQRTSVTNLNANRIDYGYDALGQLTYATGRESNNTLRSHEQLGYIYDLAGNLTQRDRNQLTTSLTVNNNNQLNTAGQSGSLTVAGRVYGSSIPISVTVNDLAANVYSDGTFARTNLALPNGVTNYNAKATDNSGRTSIDTVRINLPGTISFQYDDNGNLIRDGQRIMTYDAEDQLVGLVVTDGIYNLTQSGFVYDGLRRLRVRTEASWQGNAWVTNQVVRYVYDGMRVLQEQDGSNQAQVTYTRGLDLSGSFSGAGGIGGMLARSHHSGQTVKHFYYYADGNGNVATLLNANETVVAEYQYDPFGNLLSMRGVLAEGNLYRFSSKEYHPSSGLYYYGYRFYDPNLQRWLNRDPLGEVGGVDLYAFSANDPVNIIDPLGLMSKAECAALRGQIFRKAFDLLDDLRRYDPVEDFKGGHPMRGGKLTKPGGHYVEIKGRKRGVKNDITRYLKECICDKDNGPKGPPIPTWIDEMSNRPIPQPVAPPASNMLYIPGSPQTLRAAGDISLMTGGAILIGTGIGAGVGALIEGGATGGELVLVGAGAF